MAVTTRVDGHGAEVLPTLVRVAADGVAVADRNLRAMCRVPQTVVFATIQPAIFVLLYRYVFGGVIDIPGLAYVDYVLPGIFVQSVVFGLTNTVVGLTEDLRHGMIERFRALPMAPSAVLTGRTLADLVRNVAVLAVVAVVGLSSGFRLRTGPPEFMVAIALTLLFSYALSWLLALVALAVRHAEAAQAAVFPPMAVLVFGSSAFAPIDTMPGWLQAFASHQPVTATVDAVRSLTMGGATARPLLLCVTWSLAILATAAPLAVLVYRRTT